MPSTWTLTDQHRATFDPRHGLPLSRETRKAHPRYTAVDPQVVASRLEQAGYRVETAYGSARKAFLKSPRTAILQVTAGPVGEYAPACCIYLDHRGRSAIKINEGALRVECANAFTSPSYRIHHCSPDAELFLAHPDQYVADCMSRSHKAVDRLKSLRDHDGGDTILRFLEKAAPRLSKRMADGMAIWVPKTGNSRYSALQALTEPSVRRLDEFAGRLLADDDFVTGQGLLALQLQTHWN